MLTEDEYTVTCSELGEMANNKSFMIFFVVLLVIGLCLVGMLVFFIFKYRKTQKQYERLMQDAPKLTQLEKSLKQHAPKASDVKSFK